jgi:5-amino-6-(5-phospho-D-ribitylamino)uracil phosphatase
MKYSSIFLDIDGTTIVPGIENTPSEKVTRTIKKCIANNIPVCFATSRTLEGVKKIIQYLGLSGFHVISSGSQIYDARLKKITSEKYIHEQTIRKILGIADRYGKSVLLFDGKKDFVFDRIHMPEKVVSMYFPQLEIDVSKQMQNELRFIPEISWNRMDAWENQYECLDIVDRFASKYYGIVEVANMLGLNLQEVIGVGDGYNDFELLKACGLKVAMGNAVPELKQIADYIAPSVEEDGVADVIERYIFGTITQ